MNQDVEFDIVATTLYGLEDLLIQELDALGAQNIQKLNRAVSFTGNKKVLYRVNLETRTALRILMPIHTFHAKDEDQLYRNVREIDWSEYLGVKRTLAIDSVVNSEKFTHSHYVSLKVKDAIVDQFRDKTGKRPSVDLENPSLRINVHIDDTECSLALDSSGDSLHRRGYRTEKNLAPVNEVLAAGMVQLSGWNKERHFIDPMCGSGTIVIEAAMYAYNFAPGLLRTGFGFQDWDGYDEPLFRQLYSDCWDRVASDYDYQIIGADISGKSIRIAEENAKRAQLEGKIRFENTSLENFTPPDGDGVVVMNPPYGERMKKDDIELFYGMIGDQLKQNFAGYSAWILSANKDAIKRVGLRTSERLTLFNGPLECKFHRFDMYRGSKK